MARPERRIETLRVRVPQGTSFRTHGRDLGDSIARELSSALQQADDAVRADRLDVRVQVPAGASWGQVVPRIGSAFLAQLASKRTKT